MRNPLTHPADLAAIAIRSKLKLKPGRPEHMDPKVAEIMRRKTPGETIEMAFDAYRSARRMMEATVRQQHPEFDDEMIAKRVARRMFGGPVELFPDRHPSA